MNAIRLWLLKIKLADIDRRIGDIMPILESDQERQRRESKRQELASDQERPRRAYELQELASELALLAGLRRDTAAELDTLMSTKVPTREQLEAEARRRQTIDAWARDQEAHADAFIAKLEAQGDHRQARIWREARLHIREQLEHALR